MEKYSSLIQVGNVDKVQALLKEGKIKVNEMILGEGFPSMFVTTAEMLKLFVKYDLKVNTRNKDNLLSFFMLFLYADAKETFKILTDAGLKYTDKDICRYIIHLLISNFSVPPQFKKTLLQNVNFFASLYVETYGKKLSLLDLFTEEDLAMILIDKVCLN